MAKSGSMRDWFQTSAAVIAIKSVPPGLAFALRYTYFCEFQYQFHFIDMDFMNFD